MRSRQRLPYSLITMKLLSFLLGIFLSLIVLLSATSDSTPQGDAVVARVTLLGVVVLLMSPYLEEK
jgi:RsiW-degrading membrane proteinase PrsW (M82 family)